MKDIIIKAEVVKRELIILLSAFVLSFFMNVYAIIAYSGQLLELVTQFHIVVLLTLFFYILVLVVRLIYWGLKALWAVVFSKKGNAAA